MEDQFFDGAESDEISRSFICCVCLDLIYKPIVLACGHISCFWCVHLSMDGRHDSHCPICRQPYSYFPTICQMLHFLLLKMYPAAYKRRDKKTLEYEEEMGCFSPQFDDCVDGLHANKKLNHSADPADSSITVNGPKLCLDSCSTKGEEHCPDVMQLDCVSQPQDAVTTVSKQTSGGDSQGTTFSGEEKNALQNNPNRACQQLSIADVQCAACEQLLFRPVVLNCGHVYCETCINKPVDERVRCEVCQVLHPGGYPKVCLEFNHFLEEQFPKEYALRKEAVQLKVVCQHDAPRTYSADKQGFKWSSVLKDYLSVWRENGPKVHFGAGCDSCGMYPIVGDRYRCKDCTEKMGFDLCGDCYNTNSKLPGRFNQQHTPEHKFELVNRNFIESRTIRVMIEQLGNTSAASSLSDIVLENPEIDAPGLILIDDAPETVTSTDEETAEVNADAGLASHPPTDL